MKLLIVYLLMTINNHLVYDEIKYNYFFEEYEWPSIYLIDLESPQILVPLEDRT